MNPYISITLLCLLFALTLIFLENRMEARESEWEYKWNQVLEEKGVPCYEEN